MNVVDTRPIIALDATYAEPQPTGIGVYSDSLISGIGDLLHERDLARPAARLRLAYRPGRYLRELWSPGWMDYLFEGSLLLDRWITSPRADLFHGLNQRLPERKYPRSVVTLHERFPAPADGYSTAEFRSFMSRRIDHALSAADCIIAVSHTVKDHLAAHRPELAGKTTVVHHGVYPEDDIPEEEIRAVLQEKLGLAPGERFLLSVGAVQTRKNLINVVAALRQIPDIPLVVAGGDGHGAEEIRRFIAQQGMEDRVKLAGHLSLPEVDCCYSRAAALVFPSLEEAFGMPILEAMAQGCPVITSNVSAMPEVAGDAAILVDPGSVEEIAAAMKLVLDDPDAAARLRASGRARAAQFSWQKCARETVAVYERLLGVAIV